MTTPGDEVTALLGTAHHDVLIVAPFIRSEALSRVLTAIPEAVDLTLVSRWRPADLVAGASDLGVFDIAEARNCPLFLRHDLHAKLFAADDRCLVGSANVTATALGWRSPSNLELLTPVARGEPHIVAFEAQLLAGAVRATAQLRDQLAALIERLAEMPAIIVAEEADDLSTPGLLLPNWLPRTMNPDELFLVYTGNDSDVNRMALIVMRTELAELGVAPGMDEAGFRAWVAAAIAQTPLVGQVIERIDQFGETTETDVAQILSEIGVDTAASPPRAVLRVLERWLSYFMPARYETAQDSIKLIKARPF